MKFQAQDLLELPKFKTALEYREIQELATTQSNDYNLDVMTRLATATINFKNTIEQTDAAWILRAKHTHLLAVLFQLNLA